MTKKLVRLIKAGEEIRATPAPDDGDLAYMARHLVQATLPHSDPGKVEAWQRTNGNMTLVIRPGWDSKKHQSIGYPYGTLPRLLLFWITTEALRTRNRILYPGDTVAGFMRELGLDPTRGGPRSDAHRLRDQMTRLFHATISFEINNGNAVVGSTEHLNMPVVDRSKTWWDFRAPAQDVLFKSVIELGERFYEAIIAAPVPIDMRALRAIKGSALALDLYAWATYRAFTATQTGKPAFVSWQLLMGQFGADYSTTADFRKKAKAALVAIRKVYPSLKISDRMGGIEILPGASAVPPRRRRQKAPPPSSG
jgi:hypothetical protein